jgi:hypothetical protein
MSFFRLKIQKNPELAQAEPLVRQAATLICRSSISCLVAMRERDCQQTTLKLQHCNCADTSATGLRDMQNAARTG